MLSAQVSIWCRTEIFAGGGWGVAFLTRLRGVGNARAREQLGWRLRYRDRSAGFVAGLRPGPAC